jgi:small subunit ribosomal protein S5e
MAEVEEPVVATEETFEEAPAEEVEEEEEEFVAAGGATEIKLFGKWSFDDIEIRDISLEVRLLIRLCTQS